MAFGSLGKSANNVMIHIKGDSKSLDSAVNSSDRKLGSFASKAKAYGPMIGAAFAGAAVGFIAMSVKMAAAEEAVSRQTEALLKSQGVMWKSVSHDLNAYMKDLEELTAYNDTDLQMAFNAMIAAGMSYTQAMESMNTVTSMAFSLNRDLQGMALLVGKAYNGQTGELSRYGIVLDETLDKTEKFAGLQEYVASNFADASARTETLEGQMALLNHEMSNFAEAVGDQIIPPLTNMIQLMNKTGQSSDSLGTKLGTMITAPLAASKLFGQQIRAVLDIRKIRADGADTEEEVVNWLGLQSNRLNAINDAEFQRKMYLLEGMGYTEKAAQLELARAYGLSQEQLTLQNTLALEQSRTQELTKQTKEIEKQDKYIKSWQMKSRERGITSTDLASLGVEGEARRSGAGMIIPTSGL